MLKDGFIGPFFFQEATVTSHWYVVLLEHNTVPQLPCVARFQHDGRPYVLFWKQCPSVFKRNLPKQADWMGLIPSMVPKITRPNTTGILLLEFCKEYRVSGKKNCRSSYTVT
jgi:hypothetical protein